jgi:hypothetical protein
MGADVRGVIFDCETWIGKLIDNGLSVLLRRESGGLFLARKPPPGPPAKNS